MLTRKVRSMVKMLIALLVFPCSVWAWSGTVVGISDGDTIEVLRDSRQVRIRLYGIDCPEKGQAFRIKAKQFTSEIPHKKTVDVPEVPRDRSSVPWLQS